MNQLYIQRRSNNPIVKLFYFRISDKMKTREIMKYFLLKNPNFLMG